MDSDIAEAVNWLLNEDTEAADVMASGRDLHSVIFRNLKKTSHINQNNVLCGNVQILIVSRVKICKQCLWYSKTFANSHAYRQSKTVC